MERKKIIQGLVIGIWLIILCVVVVVVLKSLFFQVKEEIAEATITEADIEAQVFKQHEMMGAELLQAEMEPFFKDYCIKCHGPNKQKGELRLDTISYDISNIDTAANWQDILDQLNMGDMPPFDEEKHPSKREKKGAITSLTASILNARKRLSDHGGKIEMRRMNKREYAGTIKALFGFNISPHDIPDDIETPSFDTVGAEQIFTTAHFKKYLELGTLIARQGLKWGHEPLRPSKKKRVDHEKGMNSSMEKNLAKLDKQMAMKKQGKGWKEMGFKDKGEAEIIFRQFIHRADVPRRYLRYPKRKTGAYMCNLNYHGFYNHQHSDPRGEYVARVNAGRVRGVPDEHAFIKVANRKFVQGSIYVDSPIGLPTPYEIPIDNILELSGNTLVQMGLFQYNPINFNVHKVVKDDNEPYATIWIDYTELEGPFYSKERPVFEKILFPDGTIKKQPRLYQPENARELIEKFTYEAFRRKKPDFKYVTKLEQVFQSKMTTTQNFSHAMGHVFGIILASPEFLYLQEGRKDEERGAALASRELAIRLSYFLWSMPPDEALYKANLLNPVEFEAHVDRMLASPKLDRFRDGFMSQWGEFDRFDAVTVDPKKYKTFQEATRVSMKQEVLEFFGAMLKDNLPVSNLIASDFITIDPLMGHHYGVKGVSWDRKQGFKKVGVPKGSSRGGYMTQAAFLTMGANGERSSPVIRGALLLEKLMHDKPAEPPPNVEELGANRKKPMSNREMVKMHRDEAACASCHDKMDVIGFGLENFDPVGQWRKTERVGNEDVPIDPSGTLRNGDSFSSVQELRRLLLKQDDRLAEEIVESMMSYGLGRTVEFSDIDDVQVILKKLKKKKYPTRSLLKEVVMSPVFKKK